MCIRVMRNARSITAISHPNMFDTDTKIPRPEGFNVGAWSGFGNTKVSHYSRNALCDIPRQKIDDFHHSFASLRFDHDVPCNVDQSKKKESGDRQHPWKYP